MTIRRALAVLAALPLAVPAQLYARAAEPLACAENAKGECDDEANRAVNAVLDRYQAVWGPQTVEVGIELVDIVAKYHDRLSRRTRFDADTTLWIFMSGDKREQGGADYRRVVDRIRSHANRFREAGDHKGELMFLDWMTAGLPYDDQLAHARLVHRRAAQLGLLSSSWASSARSSIQITGLPLLAEGRQDEFLRALDDTYAELDAAGVEQDYWELQLTYAEALTLARRDEEADRRFAETLAMVDGHVRHTQFANNQISYYRNIAGRFAAAEEPGRLAAVASEKLNGRDDISTQKSRYNYALALLGQGKASEALPYFEEALPLQRAAESGPWSGRTDDTIILLTTLARARAQVKGRESDGLAAAVEAADRLRAKRDAGFSGGSANPVVVALAKAVAKGTRRNPLSGAFDMVMASGWAARSAEKADTIRPAFLAAQDLTLTDAGDAINEAAARDIAGSGPLGALVRQRQDAAQAVVSLSQRYREQSLGSDEARAATLRRQLDDAAAGLAPLDARIAAEFPDYATLVAPKSIDVAAVQALLAPDEAVLMLLPSEGHHYAFAISKKKALWHRVDNGAAPIAADVARLKCRIDENSCSLADYNDLLAAENRGTKSVIDERYPRYDRAAAYRLYQQLIAPVAAALPQQGRVYNVVSGPIAGLPLAALVAKAPKGDAESGAVADLEATEWLGKRYRFITLPSVSALALAQREAPADAATRPPLVAYGAPVLLGSGPTGAGSDDRGGGLRRRGGVGVRGSGFTEANGDKTMASVDKLRRLAPLPGTAMELTRLSATIGKGRGARLGAEATETALKADTDLPRAVTVVFATHGLLPHEMGIGSEPGLVLTPPGTASAEDDGLLTASEAAALSLSAKWVVLSACNTATPGVEAGASGESLSSLARSFLYAGSGNLLASHWRVADDATAALIVETLSNDGATPARALAAAMEAVRTGKHPDGSEVDGWKPHWAHPASWAPFTLVTNRDR